jgi:triosephosphate isomerase
MRVPLIAGNWKMFKTVPETLAYVNELRGLVASLAGVDIVIAPPFTALHAAAGAASGSGIGIAAQDVYWEREGAFTGAVSPMMIADAGAAFVIIGHSERRTLFGETDAMVNRKCAAAFAAGLTPIVCIGETLDQRERGETFDVLDRQITHSLDGLTADRLTRLVVAYEPVWAIGTGRNATPAQAGEAHGHIRQRLRQWFGVEAGDLCRLIYGGSVKPGNIAELAAQADVDGALVGGASLDAQGFAEIVSRARKAAV